MKIEKALAAFGMTEQDWVDDDDDDTQAYAKPWVGLTDADIKEIWLAGIDHGDDWLDVRGLARAIEAKLKRRNT